MKFAGNVVWLSTGSCIYPIQFKPKHHDQSYTRIFIQQPTNAPYAEPPPISKCTIKVGRRPIHIFTRSIDAKRSRTETL
ncbi:hypothetical protein EYC80_007082 [Monilinia laxa]|uniref:Uncharacterized protein n=1 Tax=Monilinia laxa TaxID=61186 RepID=A0A5N6K054_MONLA|nr:hypothetical protein EYC80_007082 [Monilinia laxa]